MSVDLDGPDPLKVQVADAVTARIQDGTYPPRRRIPSTAALAEEFGVSPRTITDAVLILKGRGLVRGVQGRGTFVIASDEDRADD